MTKKKLIVSLCAFALVVAVGVVGVLAATSQTARVTSHVGYTANNVKANVELVLSHGATQVDTAAWTIGTTDTGSTETVDDVAFTQADNDTITYVYSITNANSSGGRALVVTPSATVGGSTVTGAFTFGHNNCATAAITTNVGGGFDNGHITIAAGETKTITLTLTLVNARYNVDSTAVVFTLNLESASV